MQEVEALQKRVAELESELAGYEQARLELVWLATFPEHNPNIVIETDSDGNVVYVNPVGKERFPDLFSLGSTHPILVDLLKVVAELEKSGLNYIEREVDIGLAVFEQKICYFDGNRERIYIYSHDVTDYRHAEAALRESEEQNRALLSILPDPMLQLNRQGYFVACHPGANREFNCRRFLGKSIFDVLPQAAAEEVMSYVQKALEEGALQLFEHRIRFLQGVRDYEIRMVVRNEEEVLLIVRDITERKRAEQLAIRTERLAMLGLLSAAVAHEVNNPLQILQSHLDLLFDFSLDEEEQQEYRDIVRSQIERLTQVTGRILNYSRQSTFPAQPVSIPDLLQRTLALAERKLQRRNIHVSTAFEEVPPVIARSYELDQVFLNLILNAGEAAPDDGWIRVEVYAENGNVVTRIVNNGEPIPAAFLPRIFEAFVTSKEHGSGLGLWLSRNIVQKHQGQISAENLDDIEGVRFTVQLPAAPLPEG